MLDDLVNLLRACLPMVDRTSYTELNLPSPGAGVCKFAEAQAPVNTTMFSISLFGFQLFQIIME
jgi:hypothetical protein